MFWREDHLRQGRRFPTWICVQKGRWDTAFILKARSVIADRAKATFIQGAALGIEGAKQSLAALCLKGRCTYGGYARPCGVIVAIG